MWNHPLWQQAIIEITCCDHSIGACLHHIYMGANVVHILFMGNRTFNAVPTERLQEHPVLFTMNRTNRTFILWRLHLAPPWCPSHSTILLRLGSLSDKCAKLHTVAASNNRDHTLQSLYYILFAWKHIYILYIYISMSAIFTHISFVVNHTFKVAIVPNTSSILHQ